ncbi:MAG TPA: hypothetical protein VMU24_00310, partial [Candidatus Acidoferrales bacterium]|nr:hypothetical protein [Candidatus Acidoferrales bacterium]
MQKLAAHEADPCSTSIDVGEDATKSERSLFEQASNIIVQALNAPDVVQKSAEERATESLKTLEAMSSEINAVWPDANRFHFQVFNIQPILVVKMSIRTHDRFFVFGIRDESRREHKQS